MSKQARAGQARKPRTRGRRVVRLPAVIPRPASTPDPIAISAVASEDICQSSVRRNRERIKGHIENPGFYNHVDRECERSQQ